jgi:hypothetical protein
LLNRRGQQGNVYQAHQHGKWNPRSSAYGRFWIDVPGGERKRRTVSLDLCTTQWVVRLRLREYIERAGVSSKHTFHQIPVPGTTFRQQAEWWMESLSTRRRRPLNPPPSMEPDQTVDGPFAELDGPLRRAITARRGLSSGMVRESWFGI